MNEQSCNTCKSESVGPMLRLIRWFFPHRNKVPMDHLFLKYKHGVTTKTVIGLTFKDRLRVLCGGMIVSEVVTGTEQDTGGGESVSHLQVLHPSDPACPKKESK